MRQSYLSGHTKTEGPAPSWPASPFALRAWASKEKVTRTPAGVRNARCVGGLSREHSCKYEATTNPASAVRRSGEAPDPGVRRDDEVGRSLDDDKLIRVAKKPLRKRPGRGTIPASTRLPRNQLLR